MNVKKKEERRINNSVLCTYLSDYSATLFPAQRAVWNGSIQPLFPNLPDVLQRRMSKKNQPTSNDEKKNYHAVPSFFCNIKRQTTKKTNTTLNRGHSFFFFLA